MKKPKELVEECNIYGILLRMVTLAVVMLDLLNCKFHDDRLVIFFIFSSL